MIILMGVTTAPQSLVHTGQSSFDTYNLRLNSKNVILHVSYKIINEKI